MIKVVGVKDKDKESEREREREREKKVNLSKKIPKSKLRQMSTKIELNK